jgi:NAD(P)-dependent dehydrogenase (short-subunit alcohol dehydrogenase family)
MTTDPAEPLTAPPARFTGKVALVTGAASGIGAASARRLAAEGATVFAHDLDEAGLAATRAAIESAGGTIHTRTGDLSSRDECTATVADCVARAGRLDVLANVAGISRADHVTEVDEAMYRRMMGVNVDAVFHLCQASIPHLLESAGSIVNIASNAGLMGGAYTVVYCMTKGAVVQLTRALAMEYLKTPLRVNAIAPGAIDTALNAHFHMPSDVDFDLVGRYMAPRPFGEADEVAALLAFVASDEAPTIHGAILSIDNGLTAG